MNDQSVSRVRHQTVDNRVRKSLFLLFDLFLTEINYQNENFLATQAARIKT